MNYRALNDYLTLHMRMSHVYQPVMIRRLLLENGKAKDLDIAFDLIRMDESQLDYYRERVNQMVGKVLRNNGVVQKHGNEYSLQGFEELTTLQIQELITICDQKINAYQEKRGDAIWQHRSKFRAHVTGSIRYIILSRAHGRCELCGISMEKRALEVDHIVPKNWSGPDDINNFQALCYKCNANKRDTDDTDFRKILEVNATRSSDCLFCSQHEKQKVAENNLAYVIQDKYPVTNMHRLVIPKRHFSDYFSITQPELNAIQQLLQAQQVQIREKDSTVQGFNIGMNQGIAAGQTIMHCHIHLIPRRVGDMNNPKGGVRHCVEGKGLYG